MGLTKWLITKTHIDRTLNVATVPAAGIDTLFSFSFLFLLLGYVSIGFMVWIRSYFRNIIVINFVD